MTALPSFVSLVVGTRYLSCGEIELLDLAVYHEKAAKSINSNPSTINSGANE